jgi:membrane protein DedA with SNARE-associated domain
MDALFDSRILDRRSGRILAARTSGTTGKTRSKLLAKGTEAFGRHNFSASVTMPDFVSGTFRVRCTIFMLGAVVASVGWIGMSVGLSYFLGADIARRIGQAGTRALLGVPLVVAIGLALKAALSRWRAAPRGRA